METLASALPEAAAWEAYKQVIAQLIGGQDFKPIVGGHPAWAQDSATPLDAAGRHLPLLFQLDLEDEAGIVYGDSGLVYVFYDPHQAGQFFFELPCL